MNALTNAADEIEIEARRYRSRAAHSPAQADDVKPLADNLLLALRVLVITDQNVAALKRAQADAEARFAASAWEARVITALGEARFWSIRRERTARWRLLERRRCERLRAQAAEVAELSQRCAERELAFAHAAPLPE